jgi:hypothetical protein
MTSLTKASPPKYWDHKSLCTTLAMIRFHYVIASLLTGTLRDKDLTGEFQLKQGKGLPKVKKNPCVRIATSYVTSTVQ